MASTNKTTNYNLSQFIGSDKPAWLSDYNQDMNKIDTAIKSASDTATSASGAATSATTAIGDLEDLQTTVKTSVVGAVNECKTDSSTAQTSADNAYALASTAATNVSNLATYFTMSSIDNYDNLSNFSSSTGLSIDTPNITIAQNSTHSLGKIYGTIWGNVSATGQKTITLNVNSGIQPSSDITIYCAGIALTDGPVCQPRPITIVIKTNGNIELKCSLDNTGRMRFLLFPSLYFFKDFGDTPSPV